MSDVLLRRGEACDPDPFLLWDSRWDAARGFADWSLADADESLNRGGLRARDALASAVVLALFTDRRIAPSHPLYFLAGADPRGYWGDGIDVRSDLGEHELGSHLWLLERAPLTVAGQSAARWAESFARDALAPLIEQGAVVRLDVEAAADEIRGRIDLIVRLFGRDGTLAFDRKFELVWQQVAR